jgi:hypothetical protein
MPSLATSDGMVQCVVHVTSRGRMLMEFVIDPTSEATSFWLLHVDVGANTLTVNICGLRSNWF